MLIYSRDNFFINGLFFLKQDLNLIGMDDCVIFDAGSDSIFVINKILFKKLQGLEPIIAFMLCREISFLKSMKLDKVYKILRECTSEITTIDMDEILTPLEAKVMSSLCTYCCPRKVSIILGLSEKKVSEYKLKIIRRFGFNNSSLFFIEYFLWLNSWRDFMYLSDDHHQIAGYPGLSNQNVRIQSKREVLEIFRHGLVGAKLQNATSDFFELDLSNNHSPVDY